MINLYRLLMLGAFVFLPMLAPTTITTAMTGNSATRRRYRKVSSEKDKPLWVMVFILLISANIALWLGLMETRNRIVWTKMVEVRIAKVESLLNKSVKMREIEEHASDYALASGGGMVVKHSHPYFTDRKLNNWFLMKTNGGVHPDADKMLIPSFGGEPGHCFPLKGSTGFVQIKLSRPVIPQAITLEHLPKGVAYDRSNAPKDCRVIGWLQGNDMGSAVDLQKMFLLTEFKYDLEKSNAQSFKVLDLATSAVVDTIRLEFSSNHGSLSHTCIYWLRVHGYEPNSV